MFFEKIVFTGPLQCSLLLRLNLEVKYKLQSKIIFSGYFVGVIYTIISIIFSDFLMFCQTFFSPQVKQCKIITYNYGIYELSHELPNDLRNEIKILGN